METKGERGSRVGDLTARGTAAPELRGRDNSGTYEDNEKRPEAAEWKARASGEIEEGPCRPQEELTANSESGRRPPSSC